MSVRGHPASLPYASVNPKLIGGDNAQRVGEQEPREVENLLWQSLGGQQAPHHFPIHRVEGRTQIHVLNPKRLAKFHPGLHEKLYIDLRLSSDESLNAVFR